MSFEVLFWLYITVLIPGFLLVYFRSHGQKLFARLHTQSWKSLAADGKKSLIDLEKERITFYNTFVVPVSGGVLSLVFSKELNVSVKLQIPLLIAGCSVVLITQCLKLFSRYKMIQYIQSLP